MLKQASTEFTVNTRGRGLYEITDQVAGWVSRIGFRTGLVTLHVRHTSASLLIQENADPDVREDLERFFARLAPDGDPLYQHTVEGDDDMPAHIRGAWLFKGTRVPVRALFENLEDGATVDAFLDWFPGVSREQAEAVLDHAERSLATA